MGGGIGEQVEQPQDQRPRRRVADAGQPNKRRVMEHRPQVWQVVWALPCCHEVPRGHEDLYVIGVPKEQPQDQLHPDTCQQQSEISTWENLPGAA